jgi:archaellum component FlaF (FlaF/FlaG flagellin family)
MTITKTKIIFSALAAILLIAAALWAGSRNSKQNPQNQQANQVREPSIIAGEVTKIEGNAIYFKTTELTGSDSGLAVGSQNKIAIVTEGTIISREDPLASQSSTIKLADIKPGMRITVTYLESNQNKFVALKIVLELPSEKYKVENLIKGLQP